MILSHDLHNGPRLFDHGEELPTSPRADADLPSLMIEVRDRGTACELRLAGALRAGSVVALEALVEQIGCATWDEVALDLTELTSLDDVGNSVLAGLHHYMQGRGGRLTISGAHGDVRARLARAPYLLEPRPGEGHLRTADTFRQGSASASSALGAPQVRFFGAVDEQSSRSNREGD